jgi:hypothetical protein
MINHARTLLLNVSGFDGARGEIGEEYIPPNYAPAVLPSYLQTLRRVLFGAAPDRYFLNFRARELMTYLHQTELAAYVYDLDPRVTYWPEVVRPFYAPDKQVVATQFSGVKTSVPFFRGDLFADNTRGRSVREFILRATAEDGPWEARLLSKDTPGAPTVTPLVFTAALSQPVPLGSTGLSFQIQQPTTATDWEIYTLVRPQPTLSTLLPVLDLLGEPLFLSLFGVDNAQPYATFKSLWFDHPNPIYRLGGLTLGLIYRTEEAKQS